MKNKAQEAVSTAKRIVANAETFVQAVSVQTVAVFGYN